MISFLNFFILASFISHHALCNLSTKKNPIIVSYITGENFNDVSNSEKHTYVNKTQPDNIKTSIIENFHLKDELYFYKSSTKLTKHYLFSIVNVDSLFFEFNGGNMVLMKEDKDGLILKINDLYYNRNEEKELDDETDIYVDNETFSISTFDPQDDFTITNYASVCEIKNEKFLPTKYICFPSDNGEINAVFLKDNEYQKLFKSINSYMYLDNSHLINQTSNYLKNLFNIDFHPADFVYYMFNKTILCNLGYFLSGSTHNLNTDEERDNDLHLLTNKQISDRNNLLLSNIVPDDEHNRYIIWNHKNKTFINQNFENCNTFYVNQDEYLDYFNNKKLLLQVSLYNNEDLFNKEVSQNIKSISSVNEYIAFFYHYDDYVIILNNYQLYMYFKLENVLDLVLFQDKLNEISFYYVSLDDSKTNLNLYKCISNMGEVICEQISFVPYEISTENPIVYIATVQNKDISTIFISTHNKIWKIHKDDNDVYTRNIINYTTNNYEFFGHINCYDVEIIYNNKLFDMLRIYDTNNEENAYGCSYLKHINNSENSLLISFIENKQITKYVYHIANNVSYILSYGSTYVIIDSSISYHTIFYGTILILIVGYIIYKIMVFSKLGGMDQNMFNAYTKENYVSR